MASWLVPLIAVAWIIYLVPMLFKGRKRATGRDSVNGFYHQIGVLARATPTRIAPANALFVIEGGQSGLAEPGPVVRHTGRTLSLIHI